MKKTKSEPIIWARLGTGIYIETLRECHYEKAKKFMLDEYLPNEITTDVTNFIEDKASIDSFFNRVMEYLTQNASLIAIHEKTKEIVGVLVIQIIRKFDFGRVYSRESIVKGMAYKQCLKLKNMLNKQLDVFVNYNCKIYLRYYLICVKKEFHRSKVSSNLMKSGIELGRMLHINAASGIFTNLRDQRIAISIGFEKIAEYSYTEWKNMYGETLCRPRYVHETIAIMAGRLPEPIVTVPKYSLKESIHLTPVIEKKKKK